ncbi:type II toxin-antitoxin system VapC family toxin [Pannus brasiliensis CCIBt3594]|uniref:Type II toxin-antitoxin system VapC family toxin n=1 Tax=Pannus brasiliensis CCIBt3594 TaxID=1427578 RepID=A0AAW9QYQ0_9CHRO
MSDKVFIDTLFLVALINKQDRYHQKALELADRTENCTYFCTNIILFEVGNALSKNYREQAIQLIHCLLGSDRVEMVNLTPELFDRAVNFYRQHQDKEWGLVDCLSFVVMRQYQIDRALTFDKHFTQAGFQAWMR